MEDKGDPGRILRKANAALTDGNEMRMFITVFLAILDVRTGELLFSNAAHVPPLLFGKNGPCRVVELPAGKPLGVTSRGRFRTERLELKPDESLLVFTDGITEAQNPEREFFGDERFTALVDGMNRSGGAQGCVEAILAAVKDFSRGAPASDDITLLCLCYTGTPEGKQTFKTTLTNRLAEIERVLDEVDGLTGPWGCSPETAFDVRVALEEILVNINRYAAADETAVEIVLSITADPQGVRAVISDSGRPFNPLSAAAADPKRQRAERKIGGLGLHFVRNLVDELSYQRQNGRNVLTFLKKI
jgi:sigma-B regulation protein RsbU (phosphoserine phosphatase)